ncbi:sulfatase [Catenovulum agarivorans]|uniref:sulfatase family protein n=1 Tax=Catenovulum agarivorans TaxID=1172192 RepID=UPI0002FE30D2|nr:sulfatase [Catenovulum agarivorans]
MAILCQLQNNIFPRSYSSFWVQRINSLLLLSLTLLCICTPINLHASTAKPNILILVADDASWRDFGVYGNELIDTPNIDRIANNGFLSTNAFLTTSQCSPSRISILSGRYPHSTDAEDLHMPAPEGLKLIPSFLKDLGYSSALIRKSHLGKNGDKQFDFYSKNLADFPEFLNKNGDKPFFAWIGFKDPHRPYRPTNIEPPQKPENVKVAPFLIDDTATRGDLVLYYEYIRRMDGKIGVYIDELQQRGLLENTLIVFISDNGAPFPREKGSLYDSGVKTPWVMQWPAKMPAGKSSDALISVIDLAPTLLDLVGIKQPASMQGTPIKGLVEGNPAPRDYVFFERNWHNIDEHMRGVRNHRYKLIRNAYLEHPHGTASDIGDSPSYLSLIKARNNQQLTKAQARLFEMPRAEYELYDVENDPYELNNLAGQAKYAAIQAELTKALDKWLAETNDFPPSERRRHNNTDLHSGVKFDQTKLPPRIN